MVLVQVFSRRTLIPFNSQGRHALEMDLDYERKTVICRASPSFLAEFEKGMSQGTAEGERSSCLQPLAHSQTFHMWSLIVKTSFVECLAEDLALDF